MLRLKLAVNYKWVILVCGSEKLKTQWKSPEEVN